MPDRLLGPVWRSLAVWWRNALVWWRAAVRSLLGNFADPLLYLLALGYGLGRFIGDVQGVSYVVFLSSGIVATSAMNAATFEGLYLAYTRMEVQHTWDGMFAAPISLADIVMGEILWMGTKSVISAGCILTVTAALGLVTHWTALWVVPVAFMTGLCFGAMALVVTSYSRSYDFFMYYLTLFITPMILLSGVFFPLESLPEAVQSGAGLLPLRHVVGLVRPLMSGHPVSSVIAHLFVPLLFGLISVALAIVRLEKRLLH